MRPSLFLIAMQLLAGALVFDGNSLTNTVVPPARAAIAYPDQVWTLIHRGIGLRSANLAVSGQTTLDMIGRGSLVDACLSDGPTNVLVAWEVLNDLRHGASGEDAAAHWRTYCEARKAAGWTIVMMTATPTSINAGVDYEGRRQTANAILRADWPDYADALVDVGATTSALGYDGAENYPMNYPEKLHLTTVGNAIVAQMVADALVSL